MQRYFYFLTWLDKYETAPKYSLNQFSQWEVYHHLSKPIDTCIRDKGVDLHPLRDIDVFKYHSFQ